MNHQLSKLMKHETELVFRACDDTEELLQTLYQNLILWKAGLIQTSISEMVNSFELSAYLRRRRELIEAGVVYEEVLRRDALNLIRGY